MQRLISNSNYLIAYVIQKEPPRGFFFLSKQQDLFLDTIYYRVVFIYTIYHRRVFCIHNLDFHRLSFVIYTDRGDSMYDKEYSMYGKEYSMYEKKIRYRNG